MGDTTCRTIFDLASRRIGARDDGHSVSVVSNLLRDAGAVYTDGSYRTNGNLFGRIRGNATGEGSASIVARGYDESYIAVRMDLTGIDSAELVGAAVAGTLGSGHRDQVTDCKSLLAIEARARTDRPVKYHQRGLFAGIKQARHRLHWHCSHPEKREGPWGEDDVAVWMADKTAEGTASQWQRGRVMHHLGNIDTEEVRSDGEVTHLYEVRGAAQHSPDQGGNHGGGGKAL